jgi:hypothetical protein
MAMVDVDRVGLEDLLKLVDKGLPCRLNAEDLIDLLHVVAVGPTAVDLLVAQALPKIASRGLEHYLLVPLLIHLPELLTVLGTKHHLLRSFHRFQPLDSGDKYVLDLGLAAS